MVHSTVLSSARAALSAGQVDDALRLLRRHLVLHPDDCEARRTLFDALVAARRYDDAALTGAAVLEAGGADDELRLALGRIHAAESRWEAVERILGPLSERDRAAAALYLHARTQLGRDTGLANPSIRLRQTAGATFGRLYFVEQLLDWIGDPGESNDARLLVEQLKDGRYADAAPTFERWVSALADSVYADVARADWYLIAGDPRAARTVLVQHARTGNVGAVWNRLGDCALWDNDLDGARTAYRKATIANPSDGNAWLDLARVESLLGNRSAAEAAARKAAGVVNGADQHRVRSILQQLSDGNAYRRTPGLYGLVWHDSGGDILDVEMAATPSGGLLITGNVGPQLEEAARVALTVAQYRRGPPSLLGFHIHFPRTYLHKDGGSAGLLLACMILTMHRDASSVHRIGITGELKLDGSVLRIGGLREKLIAAHLAGFDRVLIPYANTPDLAFVGGALLRDLEIQPVKTLDDALELL